MKLKIFHSSTPSQSSQNGAPNARASSAGKSTQSTHDAATATPHSDVVTCIGWNGSSELYTIGDDGKVLHWSMRGDLLGNVACELSPVSGIVSANGNAGTGTIVSALGADANKNRAAQKKSPFATDSSSNGTPYITDLDWFPSKTKMSKSSELFVVGCTDCTFRLISKNGRVERTIKDAHKGAVVKVKWNYEGSAIATCGEDGLLKVWSRGGQLRSTVANTGRCIYAIAWAPNSERILFTSGKDLVIKPIHSSSKQLQWKAHDALVLCVDWNPLSNLIVSGSEDGKYKVWDEYGRSLFVSTPFDHAVTSLKWNPDGELFAVGTYNTIKLCDKNGWSYDRVALDSVDSDPMQSPSSTNIANAATGSVMAISWTDDGTQFAMGTGSGQVYFAQLSDRKIEWNQFVVTLHDDLKLRIHDISQDVTEELDFRDIVISMSLAYGHLVVCTSSQCWIYDVNNLTSPHVFDLKETVTMIKMARKCFLLVDHFAGVQTFSYEGRLISNPKFTGLRTEFLNKDNLGLSNDYLAIVDKAQGQSKQIRIFDIQTGKQIMDPVIHNMEIMEVHLNQMGSSDNRMLAFVDRNRDLYITLLKSRNLPDLHEFVNYKICTMVDSVSWNDSTDMLVACSDQKLTVWYYPLMFYVDKDLLPKVRATKEQMDLGKSGRIESFVENRVVVRKLNGARVTINVSPYPKSLYQLQQEEKWSSAIRLCRFVREYTLWACLAGMSIKAGHLQTAEVALATLEEVDKLEYITSISRLKNEEAKSAELALYQRRPQEAESILLQAGLIYRAIKMNILRYDWDRAFEIATRHKVHVDTLLAYRSQYNELYHDGEELDKKFMQIRDVEWDWETVKQKEAQEE
mmetsp:Transcript_9747/g.36287  ORF Transcript_9747/g.36287 Transcript_9747/m.36287 type:complete len:855 (-) Transcript_9747:37-2601(-)